MTTKMDVLRKAYDQYRGRGKKYEQDSWNFVTEFQHQLADYLSCELREVRLVDLSQYRREIAIQKRFHSFAGSNKMWLDTAGYWHFAYRLVMKWSMQMNPTPHESPQEWVGLSLYVKPETQGQFSLFFPPNDLKVTVTENDFAKALECAYEAALDFLESDFQDSLAGIHSNSLSIGYRLPDG